MKTFKKITLESKADYSLKGYLWCLLNIMSDFFFQMEWAGV